MRRIAIVGLGRIGRLWTAIAGEHGVEVATVDPNNPDAEFAELSDRLLAEVDGVVVCSPTATHVAITVRALEAGVPVLCEKPLALDADGIRRCFAAAAAAAADRPRLLVGMNRRWDPALWAALRAVAPGPKSAAVSIDCRDHPRPTLAFLRQSGGVFHDCLVHELDLIENVLGVRIDDVIGVHHHAADDDDGGAGPVDVDTMASATVLLRGSGGETIVIRFCRISDRYVHSVMVNGTVVELPGPPGSGFQDRFRPAFAALFKTFQRMADGQPTAADLARIPTEWQCFRLLGLCDRITAMLTPA